MDRAEQVNTLQTQLDEQRRILDIHHQIARLTSDGDWETALPHMAEQLAALFRADACALTLWDTATQKVKRLAAWGIDANDFLEEQRRPTGVPSLTRKIVEDKQPVFINDAAGQKQHPTPLIQEYGVKTLVAIPLMARGRAIGAAFLMRLDSEEPFIAATVQQALPSLEQLALVIDNQLLLADTQKRLHETNALLELASLAANSPNLDGMLAQVLDFCRQALNIEAGAILLYQPDSHTLDYYSGSGILKLTEQSSQIHIPLNKPGLLTDVFHGGQPQFINDPTKLDNTLQQLIRDNPIQNLLIAPLRTHDMTLGEFVVVNKDGGFSYTDAGLLMAMSTYIAASLRNAQLLQSTRDRLGESEILQRIAAITSATIDQDEMLLVAFREITNVFEVESAVMYLPDRGGKKLQLHTASQLITPKGRLSSFVMIDSDDPIARVFKTGEPLLLNQASTRWKNALIVPLNTHQGIIGAIALINPKSGLFTAGHGDLALAIASQMAVGMQSVQLLNAERERADLMLLINRIAQDLSATLDLRGLMRKVVSNIHDSLGYDAVYIFLEEGEGKLVCHASATTDPRHAVEIGYSLPTSQGIIGRVIRTRQAAMVGDVSSDPDYVLGANHQDFHSTLALPLKHGDTVFGVIELLGREEHAFDQTDLVAIENLASQISVAIDNARLYNQAQRRLLEQGIVHQIGQDLTAILNYNELVAAVARHMTRALDTSSCTVILYDAEHERLFIEAEYMMPSTDSISQTQTMRVSSSYPISRLHAAREAIQTRKVVINYSDDASHKPEQVSQLQLNNAQSELIAPMAVGNRVIGVVRWAESRRLRRFSRDDERLAHTLISQAAIAIENARLFRETQRRAQEQSLLNKLTVSLTAANNAAELIERFLEQVHNAMNAKATLIGLLKDDEWVIEAAHIPTELDNQSLLLPRLIETHFKTGRHIWQSIQQGLSVYAISDLATQTPAQMELLMLTGEASSALVPINYRGHLVGVVEVLAAANLPFDLAAIQLLEALTNQAAVTLNNVRLSEREQRRLAQMERLQASGRLISSELVMQSLLELVVREAAQVFEIDAIAFATPDDLGISEVIRASHGLSEKYVRERSWPMLSVSQLREMDDAQRRNIAYFADLESTINNETQKALVQAEGLKSALVIPLVKGITKFGSLVLYSRQANHRFDEEDLEIARLLASQVAIALDNADLFLKLEERARELAEANRLRSQFLANISHELRTPMNSILGFSETLLGGLYGDLNEKQASRIDRIFQNGKNLLALIDDLLDISKIDAGKMEIAIERVHVQDEIQGALNSYESLAQKKEIYLKANLPDNALYLRADTLRVRQVITNLVGNAVKFTKTGGVTISAEARQETILSPNPGEPDTQDVVWFSVRDTGIGISLEHQLIIFDEFRQVDGSTTREYGGTGLGLAICKRLIEHMGGRIWVDSEEGVGSTFTFVLPASPSA